MTIYQLRLLRTRRKEWTFETINWTKGVRREIKDLIESSGDVGFYSSEMAAIANWTNHESMCLIEYMVRKGALKRKPNDIRRYAIDPSYNGDLLRDFFS